MYYKQYSTVQLQVFYFYTLNRLRNVLGGKQVLRHSCTLSVAQRFGMHTKTRINRLPIDMFTPCNFICRSLPKLDTTIRQF